MPPSSPRLRVLSFGGNAVSAFLSWRLGATNSCDVTLVWKNGFEAVHQYGISFKSEKFGNERFKPRHVVQRPEDARVREAAFDYVIVCLKALPDVYDLSDVIAPAITPQHTCILVNTTNALGVEKQIQDRFPKNVVLSLVSGVQIAQLGSSEFEHTGSSEIWIGSTNDDRSTPNELLTAMTEALQFTLSQGSVDCQISPNIRQQQFELLIGPIAFHPTSVLFETPTHSELIQKVGVRELISGLIDELCQVATSCGCSFPENFREKTIEAMIVGTDSPSIMYQDFLARKPMEVETFLGAPLRFAAEAGLKAPRLQTLYALLHSANTLNLSRPPPSVSPTIPQAPPRMSSVPPPRPHINGAGRGRMPPGPPGMGMSMPRRGPPPMNGFRGPPNGYPPRGPNQMSRRPSFEDNNLEDFSHVVLYEELPEGDIAGTYADMPNGQPPPSDLALREREIMLREREIALREQSMMGMGPKRGGGRRFSHRRREPDFDEDEDDDYFDPMEARTPRAPIDDNVDMLSVTSRRTRKAVSSSQLRKDPTMSGNVRPGSFSRPMMGGRNRSSATVMRDVPGLHDNVLDNPMMSYASNRFGNVDRKMMHDESRANSLTASRLQEFQQGGGFGSNGGYPMPPSRRTSQSPGNPLSPMGRGNGRPSPPNDHHPQPNGMPMNGMPINGIPMNGGRPSPPGGMRAPMPRYPPGQGNSVQPSQVESQIGVSKPLPPFKGAPKSLTGSASASAGSGDSGSGNVDTEPSASSSQSSFVPRQLMSVQ